MEPTITVDILAYITPNPGRIPNLDKTPEPNTSLTSIGSDKQNLLAGQTVTISTTLTVNAQRTVSSNIVNLSSSSGSSVTLTTAAPEVNWFFV